MSRNRKIEVSLSESELVEIDEAAGLVGQSRVTFMRGVALAEARNAVLDHRRREAELAALAERGFVERLDAPADG